MCLAGIPRRSLRTGRGRSFKIRYPLVMAHLALIVGHTPQAPGAVSIDGTTEYAYNSIVADFLETKLRVLGYRVSRVARGLPNDLPGLPGKVNATGADLAVELHFNSFGDPSANGCETLHWHSSVDGRALAMYIQKAVLQSFSLRNRGLIPIRGNDRGHILLRGTAMPCILTEPFFGSSPTNWARMKDAHEQLAGAYAHGIASYAHHKGLAPASSVDVTLHPPLVQGVIDAWTVSGPDSALHQQAQANLDRDWPALANALRQLAA